MSTPVPSGTIVAFHRLDLQAPFPPEGWLVCDGVKKDGITPPDLSGRFLLGAAALGQEGTEGGAPVNAAKEVLGSVTNENPDPHGNSPWPNGLGFGATGAHFVGRATVPYPPFYTVVYLIKK